MGLQIIKSPSGTPNAGMFNLPPDFDIKKFAAEWVLEAQVEYKKQREHLPGTNLTADGWEVWKKNKTSEVIKVTSSANKVYVLMCRPRKLQDQVNAVFGNVSKQAINRELVGESLVSEESVDSAGKPIEKSGILTEQRLKKEIGGEKSFSDESAFKMNDINLTDQPAATIETT
jgi:hypothetical protein